MQGSKDWTILCCLPWPSKEPDWSGAAGTQSAASMRCWLCRWRLTMLYRSTSLKASHKAVLSLDSSLSGIVPCPWYVLTWLFFFSMNKWIICELQQVKVFLQILEHDCSAPHVVVEFCLCAQENGCAVRVVGTQRRLFRARQNLQYREGACVYRRKGYLGEKRLPESVNGRSVLAMQKLARRTGKWFRMFLWKVSNPGYIYISFRCLLF